MMDEWFGHDHISPEFPESGRRYIDGLWMDCSCQSIDLAFHASPGIDSQCFPVLIAVVVWSSALLDACRDRQ